MNQTVEILKKHIENKRMAHAYLFVGPYTPVMEKILADFVRAINCQSGNLFLSCDCISCKKIEGRNHPDVHWLGEDIKVKTIKIEEIRELLAQDALRPYEGRHKVFVLPQASRLSNDAANAFLKTLEEPSPETVLLLQVENRAQVLETIRSRCFEIRLYTEEEVGSASVMDEIMGGSWMGWLDQFQAVQRKEAIEGLDLLMYTMRRYFIDNDGIISAGQYADAIDRISETKDAIEQNVNQKLALTRLSLHLERMPVSYHG